MSVKNIMSTYYDERDLDEYPIRIACNLELHR